MLLKYGVNPTISGQVTNLFDAIDAIFVATAKREGIITSANDSRHMKGSRHYSIKGAKGATKNESGAVDLRTRDMSIANIDIAVQRLNHLSKHKAPRGKTSLFDVVKESSHIHLEIDPK